MRKMLTLIAFCLTISVAASGCGAWWNEIITSDSGEYARSTLCDISLPSDQPNSGWIRVKVIEAWNGRVSPGTWQPYTAWMVADYAPTAQNHSFHFTQSEGDRMVWNGTSQGVKSVAGIYPGESYRMGFSAPPGPMRANMLSRVELSDGTVLSTYAPGCPIYNE